MRAFLDANLSISFLLSGTVTIPPSVVAQAGIDDRYTLLASRNVLAEPRSKIATKPFPVSRVPTAAAEARASIVSAGAEVVPNSAGVLPRFSRDRDDDYLIALALLGRADHLVSGDNDLLALAEVETVRIVGPAEFPAILRDAGRV